MAEPKGDAPVNEDGEITEKADSRLIIPRRSEGFVMARTAGSKGRPHSVKNTKTYRLLGTLGEGDPQQIADTDDYLYKRYLKLKDKAKPTKVEEGELQSLRQLYVTDGEAGAGN